MTVKMLVAELKTLGIPDRWYSINGDLTSDKLFLRSLHGRWEYFYFDERGNYRDVIWFEDEDSACKHLLEQLKLELEYYNKK